MALVLNTTGSFTASGLSILSRDPSLGSGGKFSTNVHDPWAFVEQSIIAGGVSATLRNLADNGINNAVANGPLGFAIANGGMGFGANTTDNILLPDVAKPTSTATDVTGEGLYIFWIKSAAVQTAANVGMVGWADSGSVGVLEFRYQTMTTSPLLVVSAAFHNAGSNNHFDNGGLLGVVIQYALSFELVAGVYHTKLFKNGVILGTEVVSTLSAIPLPVSPLEFGKSRTGTQWAGQFFRATFDNLSAETPEAIVARDYNMFNGVFV